MARLSQRDPLTCEQMLFQSTLQMMTMPVTMALTLSISKDVDVTGIIAPHYVSFVMPMTTAVDADDDSTDFDVLRDPKVLAAITYLSPAIWKIGGPWADHTYYLGMENSYTDGSDGGNTGGIDSDMIPTTSATVDTIMTTMMASPTDADYNFTSPTMDSNNTNETLTGATDTSSNTLPTTMFLNP